MGLHVSAGRTLGITELYLQVKRRKFQFIHCFGFFIGNTFIGITRVRK